MSLGLGGLGGTLNEMQVLSLMENLQRQQQEELAAKTQAATQAASQAQGAYQQAAAAPPPQLPLADLFVPSLLGNVASVIGGNPAYAQQAQEGIQQSRSEQTRARADNLQALRDISLEKAKRAEEAQDFETAERSRRQYETLSKALEVSTGMAERQQKAELEKAKASQPGGRSGSGVNQDDVEAIADAIQNGDQPPDMKGMYRYGGPVRAALAKRGYDMTSAQKDWQAVNRHISTLNNSQQLRLRTAAETAYESLDLIDEFSKKLSETVPRGAVPLLNRQAMRLAMQGTFGTEAQIAANNLNIQIGDLQAEIAQVFRGGYAPTNEAMKQAANQLKGEWTLETLAAATDLARRNLRIRLNSLNHAQPLTERGAVGEGGGAPAAEPPAPATTGKVVTMIDKTGKKRYIDESEVEDAISKGGWKRAGK